MNLYLFESVGDFVLHLSIFDFQLLQLVSHFDLPGLGTISGPDSALLHDLELTADVFDQLLLLKLHRPHLPFYLLWELFLNLEQFPID